MTRSPENNPVLAVCPEAQRRGGKWASDARNLMLRRRVTFTWYSGRRCVHECAYRYTHTYIYTQVCVCVYISVYVHRSICVHIQVCVCIQGYV